MTPDVFDHLIPETTDIDSWFEDDTPKGRQDEDGDFCPPADDIEPLDFD